MNAEFLMLVVLFSVENNAATIKKNTDESEIEGIMSKIIRANRDKEIPFFEGDIVLPLHKPNRGKNAIIDQNLKWSSNIPYVIGSEYTYEVREAIGVALQEFNVRLCINFVPRQNEETYIVFKKSRGCSSSVGMIGGKQIVSLADGCENPGVIKHEAMHALGFWHEHSRYDRDDFVQIMWENVIDGKEHNFNKFTNSQITTLDEPYDYKSLLHYDSHAFSSNGEPTIVALQTGGEWMGQRKGFSDIDLNKLRKLYGCASLNGWSDWTIYGSCDIQCKKYRKRFCEGSSCTEYEQTEKADCNSTECTLNRDPDCSASVISSTYGSVTSSLFPFDYKVNVECTQTITVPSEYTIELQFEFIDIEHYQEICYYDWLNIYDGANKTARLIGTYCGTSTPPTIHSTGNSLTLSLFSDSSLSERGFLANYYTAAPGTPLGICHFEGDISACGWTHDETADFQWTSGYGSTISGETGPSYDHTTGEDKGHYYFIETSSPQTSGMKARLLTPTYPAPTTGHCLEFYYNMYGKNIDSITVMQQQEVNSGTIESLTIFSMGGNHGNDNWLQAKINIFGQYPYNLCFQGTRGNGWQGDIAIDDVTIHPVPCESL